MMGPEVTDGRPEAVPVAEALAVDRRRDLLQYLDAQSNAIDMSMLAQELASYRQSAPGEPGAVRVAILNSHLKHVDIPTLRQADLVAHDPEQNTLELTPQAETLTPPSDT